MKKKWVSRHCDLALWLKVTKFNRVRASAVSNHLVKTASKSVHPFGWNFVHKKCRTHRQTDRQTYTQTNWSENITLPRFRGGVIIFVNSALSTYTVLTPVDPQNRLLWSFSSRNNRLLSPFPASEKNVQH